MRWGEFWASVAETENAITETEQRKAADKAAADPALAHEDYLAELTGRPLPSSNRKLN
jgi:hypothetical protein